MGSFNIFQHISFLKIIFHNITKTYLKYYNRDDFKTQSPVDRPISIVLSNDNHPEPGGTVGQPAIGFWSRP